MAETISMRTQVGSFVVRLAKAVNTYSIYQKGHRITNEIIREVYDKVTDILAKRPEFIIGIIAEEVAFERKPFIEMSVQLQDFILNLRTKGVKKITFSQGLNEKELAGFIAILAQKMLPGNHFEDIKATLDKQQIKHIRIGQISIEEEELLLYGVSDAKGLVKKSIQKGLDVLERQIGHINQHQAVDVESVRLVSAALVNCLFVNKNLLMMLTSIKLLNENKYMHNVIVCVFTMLQAELLGLDKKYYMDIAAAALMYNIGTLKSEPHSMQDSDLSESGEEIGRNLDGAKILMDTEGISALAPLASIEYDCPYAHSKKLEIMYGKGLNLVSMMIAIAKTYDEFRNDPDHVKDGGVERIYDKMMALSGKQFHPDLLNNFFNAVGVFPPGTLVQLDTGEVALVIRSSFLDVRRPQVELLYDRQGNRYAAAVLVSLLEKGAKGQYRRSIQKSLIPSSLHKIPVEILM